MKNKEKKFYANKIIALEKELSTNLDKTKKKNIQMKIESLVHEILKSPNGEEAFFEINEIIEKNICK